MKLTIIGLATVAIAIAFFVFSSKDVEPDDLQVDMEVSQPLGEEDRMSPIELDQDQYGFKLLAVSVQDSKAVLDSSHTKMKLVSPGDEVAQGQFKVIQITHEKLVLRELKTGDHIWVFLASDRNESRMVKISSTPEGITPVEVVSVPAIDPSPKNN